MSFLRGASLREAVSRNLREPLIILENALKKGEHSDNVPMQVAASKLEDALEFAVSSTAAEPRASNEDIQEFLRGSPERCLARARKYLENQTKLFSWHAPVESAHDLAQERDPVELARVLLENLADSRRDLGIMTRIDAVVAESLDQCGIANIGDAEFTLKILLRETLGMAGDVDVDVSFSDRQRSASVLMKIGRGLELEREKEAQKEVENDFSPM